MKYNSVSLYSLADWQNGLAYKNIEFTTAGMPVIKIAELKNGITQQTKFTNANYDNGVRLSHGDMLFSWSGNPLTSIDVFIFKLPSGWLNQHIFKVSPKSDIDFNYLFYLLKSLKPKFTKIASNKQTTGLGHVTIKDLKEISINLPPKAIQYSIGNFLYKIDEKIRINSQINDNLAA